MGILDIEEYKTEVKKQKDYEIALKEKLAKEISISFKPQNIRRIEKRIEILEIELKQNMEEAQEEEIKMQEDKNNLSEKINQIHEKIIIDTDEKSMTNTISTGVSLNEFKKPSGQEYVKDKILYESLKFRLEEYKEASQYFSKIVKD